MKKKVVVASICISVLGMLSDCTWVYARYSGGTLDGILPSYEEATDQLNKIESYRFVDGERVYNGCYNYEYTSGKISTITGEDSEGRTTSVNSFSYNDSGQIISSSYENLEEPDRSDTTQYFYSNDGILTENDQYDKQNNLQYQRKYIFDSSNKLIESHIYSEDSGNTSSSYFEYDDQDNIIWEDYSESENDKRQRWYTYSYTYDESGNILTSTKESNSTKIIDTFENGKIIKKEFYILGELFLEDIYQYLEDDVINNENDISENNSGVALAEFIKRYNEGVDYYNVIAERDGYNKTSYITENDLAGEDYMPSGNMKITVNPNATNKDLVGIINVWADDTAKIDTNVGTGEIMAMLYAFDPALTDCSKALELWGQMNENAEVQQDGITFDNYSFDNMVMIKAEYEGFVENSMSTESEDTDNFFDITSEEKLKKLVMLDGETKEAYENTIGIQLDDSKLYSDDGEKETYKIEGYLGQYKGTFVISFNKASNFSYSTQFEYSDNVSQKDDFLKSMDALLNQNHSIDGSSARWMMDDYTVRCFNENSSYVIFFVKHWDIS